MSSASDSFLNVFNSYKTFSGTDTLVFALFPGSQPVVMGAITTISYSSYRSKKPVINLGRININGVTRGTRIYAGTMIFTLINQHWLKDVQEQKNVSWLKNYKDLKADELPLFDIMIVSANEYGSYVYMYIYGVDFTDSAQTISVEDLFTENTFSFIARDVQDFKAGNPLSGLTDKANSLISGIITSGVLASDDDDRLINIFNRKREEKKNEETRDNYVKYTSSFNEEMYYSTTKPFVGTNVANLQSDLTMSGYTTPVTYIFDKATEESLSEFQASQGYYDKLGVYDYRTHYLLRNNLADDSDSTFDRSIVVNRSGANVYEHPNSSSNIVTVKPYNAEVDIYGKYDAQIINPNGTYDQSTKETGFDFYRINEGYVFTYDVYTPNHLSTTTQFPTIKENMYSYYVKILQDILKERYGDFEYISGQLGRATLDLINKIQEENNFEKTDMIDQQTWQLILGLNSEYVHRFENKSVSLLYKIIPGSYDLTSGSVGSNFINSLSDVSIKTDKEINVKITAVCHYGSNKTKTKTETIVMNNGQIIPSTILKNALVYDPRFGAPNKIQYYIYPYNQEAFLWTINIGG